MEDERLEELRKKSTSGSTGIKKSKKMNITREEYITRMKIIAGTTAIAVSLLIGGGSLLVNKLMDKATLSTLRSEYYNELINGNIHRTDDRENIWYDYGNIAEELKQQNDFDEALYFMNIYLGDEKTDNVLIYTDYKDFENYKEQKGYSSSEDFRDRMKKRALVKYDIDKKQKELKEMQEELTPNKDIVEVDKGYGDR